MVYKTRVLGDEGERLAAEFLMKQGYNVVARNERWLGGEVDLIMSRGNVFAFIEVKARARASQFPLSNVVTLSKQRKIIKTALRFIAQQRIHDVVIRFDVCLVTLHANKNHDIQHIPNAFTASEI